MPRDHLHQINLQDEVMGGEIFTLFFTRALLKLGVRVTLYVSARNPFWSNTTMEGVELVWIERADRLPALLPDEPSVVLLNGPAPQEVLAELQKRHLLVGFAHMPAFGRDPSGYALLDTVFCVSQYVYEGLRNCGLTNLYDEPFYGVAEFRRTGVTQDRIVARSRYAWDRRKIRDRALSILQPVWQALRPTLIYERRPGLTLGIVSAIVPIKQFPLLFFYVAPILAKYPEVNLDIFGSGGYAQVRDLSVALRPLGARVRFWGHQPAPQHVYPCIDYLLAGLPEKEALGLNIIEAQACGTPVLAINAPPFVETILDRRTGLLYEDPRKDNGADFERVISRLVAGLRLDPRVEKSHLERFSAQSFERRVDKMLKYLVERMAAYRARTAIQLHPCSGDASIH